MAVELLLLLVCVVVSGFASGSETALVSASRTRLKHLATEGRASAHRALALLEDKERILVVTLIATNVFNISAGAVATLTLTRTLGTIGPFVATLGMTAALVLFGEIVPKAYFRHHAEQALMKAATFWQIFAWVCLPITVPAQLVSGLILRLLGSEKKRIYRTRDEIKLLLEESAESGGLGQEQQEMLESTLSYSTTIVREVMVPISEVALMPETARTEAFLGVVRKQGYTRIPVYRDRVDQIIGLVNVFDVLYDRKSKTFVRPYIRPIRLVPETKQIDELFMEMQRERESIAVVVNEFGACFGIVALEDIMEEIFGELADEHEDVSPEIQRKGPGHFRVSGMTDIDDLKDETGLAIAKKGFETVGGYVLQRLGRIPRKGESFEDGDYTVHIAAADRYSVKTVEFIRKETVDTD
jgi:putative hemolysin